MPATPASVHHDAARAPALLARIFGVIALFAVILGLVAGYFSAGPAGESDAYFMTSETASSAPNAAPLSLSHQRAALD